MAVFIILTKREKFLKRSFPGENVNYPVFTGLALRDAVEKKEEVDALIRSGLENNSII